MGRPELLTRSELAESLGVNPGSIARWVSDGMPIAERGSDGRGGRGHGHRYRDADARAWLAARQSNGEGSVVDLTAARTRKELALADVSELKAGEMRAELLPREEVESAWRAENSAVRALLLSWSMTISDSVYHTAISDGLPAVEREHGRAVHEVLSELSDTGRSIECPHCGANLSEIPEPQCGDEVRCCATTKGGDRCGNPAGGDGFCGIRSHGAVVMI